MLIMQLSFVDSSQVDSPCQLGAAEFPCASEIAFQYSDWAPSRRYSRLREWEHSYIVRVVTHWAGDVQPVLDVLEPWGGTFAFSHQGTRAGEIHKELCRIAIGAFARSILKRFHDRDFIKMLWGREDGSYSVQRVLFDISGPLWTELRTETLAVFAEAREAPAVQGNLYTLLEWLNHLLRKEPGLGFAQGFAQVMSDKEIVGAIWSGAMCVPLNDRPIGLIRELPDQLKAMGVEVTVPEWWDATLKQLGLSPKAEAPPKADPAEHPTGSVPESLGGGVDEHHA
jgi:hypothetical protein